MQEFWTINSVALPSKNRDITTENHATVLGQTIISGRRKLDFHLKILGEPETANGEGGDFGRVSISPVFVGDFLGEWMLETHGKNHIGFAWGLKKTVSIDFFQRYTPEI